jgi:hypothetical protein
MHEYGHDKHGIAHYLAFALNLGLVGLLKLARCYASAVSELFRLRREQVCAEADSLRDEHHRRMVLLAQSTRVGVDRLRALASLQVAPITRTVSGILASVLLDRIALGLVAGLTVLAVAALTVVHVLHAWWAAPCLLLGWAVGDRQLARRRTVDPEKRMIERAAHLAKLFPAAFVVMGHTHTPAKMAINGGEASYINLGSWAEEESDNGEATDRAYRAARTHLVIRDGEDGPVAEFLAWGADGPRRFSPVQRAVYGTTVEAGAST